MRIKFLCRCCARFGALEGVFNDRPNVWRLWPTASGIEETLGFQRHCGVTFRMWRLLAFHAFVEGEGPRNGVCEVWENYDWPIHAWCPRPWYPACTGCNGTTLFPGCCGLLEARLFAREFRCQRIVGCLDHGVHDPSHVVAAKWCQLSFSISYRNVAVEIDKQLARELEEKDRELAERVAEATLAQLKSQIITDMEILKQLLPSPDKEAHEASLDIKYLQKRQQTLAVQWFSSCICSLV